MNIGFAVVVTAAVVFGLLYLARLDNRQDSLEQRIELLECVHRIFEDGGAMHEDAEVVARLCPDMVPRP